MKTFDGFLKRKLGDNNVLLAGGDHKALSDFIGSISYDSSTRKIKYTPVGGSATDLVTFGTLAFDSTSYLPLTGGTLTANNSWLSPARLQLLRPDTTTYTDRACVGVTDGNLHIDPYQNKGLYLNFYSSAGNVYFNGGSYYINGGYYNGTAAAANSVAWSNVSGKPSEYNPSTHYHDDRYTKGTRSPRDFTLGTLVRTDIDYSQTSGASFLGIIRADTYNTQQCFTTFSGYIYSNTIISYGLTNMSSFRITSLIAQNVGGKLCFWMPRLGYWQSFGFTVYTSWSDYITNHVTSIENASDPNGSKRVEICTHTYNMAQTTEIPSTIAWSNVTGGVCNGGQFCFSKIDDHAIQVGNIRGYGSNGQSGNYIHMYERVHIGSPSGWGSRSAPSYGLSTYGGAWLATDTGNVGIGTTSPSYKLHVNGNVGASNYYSSSDINKKENIKRICPILPLYSFNWKESGEKSYGFIAQYLEDLGYTELVNGEEGNKSVNYSAALSWAMAILSNVVDDLRGRIIQLENKLSKYENL